MNYPKDPQENKKYRLKMLEETETDLDLRSLIISKCQSDRLFFFNVILWTYDPRSEGKHLPFITYPFQDEAILWDAECAEKGIDNCIEKSRDMGATWLLVANDYYEWVFQKTRIEIRWGSRKEMYVDTKGDMDSIFEKFRYLISKTPKWMLPHGYNSNLHSNNMRLVNPETGSIISGEATNDNFGRGGRKYRLRFDELAFWDCDKNAWNGTADVTNCRSAISTPKGSNNQFARVVFSDTSKMTLHWTKHPDKSRGCFYINDKGQREELSSDEGFKKWQEGVLVRSPWYDREVQRRNDSVAIAQELDIDYERSDGSMLLKLSDIRSCVGKIFGYDKEKRFVSLDPSREGQDKAVFKVFYNYDVVETVRLNTCTTMELVGQCLMLEDKHKTNAFVIDRGEGSGVIDRLSELMHSREAHMRSKIFEVKYGASAFDSERYFNRRAEMYFYTRDKILGKMVPMEDDPDLHNQLANIPYEYASDKRWKLKTKDQIVKLIGHSPDDADCYVQGIFYEQYVAPVVFATMSTDYNRNGMPNIRKSSTNGYGWKKGV